MHKLLRGKTLATLVEEAEDLQRKSDDSSITHEKARDQLAISYGFFSWRQMEVHVLLQDQEFDDFLYLSCLTYCTTDHPRQRERARAMLLEDPSLAERDVHHAAAVGNTATVERMLNADPQLVSQRGGFFDWEPLLYACYSRLNLPASSTFDVAKLLLDRGADANAYYMWGGQYRFTALTGAFGEGEMGPSNQPEHERCVELASLLLEAGADPNDGQALYNRMFEPGQFWIELLLKHGLNSGHSINWLDEDGKNLFPSKECILDYQLRWAVEKGHIERARLLIDAGANATAKNRFGDSYSTIAFKRGDLEFAEELASLGSQRQELPEVERFIAVCMSGNIREAKALLEGNPNLVEKAENDFANTVGRAAGEGNLKGLKVFRELGFNLDKMQGQTPLHQAVLGGHIDTVKWLVEIGRELGIRDDVHGSTPLQWAFALGRDECRDFLSQFDLDLFDSILCDRTDRINEIVRSDESALERTLKEVRNSQYSFEDDWMTPLVFAMTRERVEATKRLLTLGANRQITAPSGETLEDLVRNKAPTAISDLW